MAQVHELQELCQAHDVQVSSDHGVEQLLGQRADAGVRFLREVEHVLPLRRDLVHDAVAVVALRARPRQRPADLAIT